MCEPWAAPAAPRAVKPPPITPSTHSQAQCHPAYTEPASQEPLSTRTHRLPQKRDAVTRPHVAVTWRTICTSSFFLQQQPSSPHAQHAASRLSLNPCRRIPSHAVLGCWFSPLETCRVLTGAQHARRSPRAPYAKDRGDGSARPPPCARGAPGSQGSGPTRCSLQPGDGKPTVPASGNSAY